MDTVAVILAGFIVFGIVVAVAVMSYSAGYRNGVLDERSRYIRWRHRPDDEDFWSGMT